MTHSFLTRLTGLLLVAGFFISCTTSRTSLDQLVANNNYEQAINEINQRLEENPEQPGLYIRKGEITALMAQEEDPAVRQNHYQATVQAFDNAINYGASSPQVSTIDSLRQQYWKLEHNAGLRVFDNEILSDRYQAAQYHFENALILRPGSVSSHKNLAVSHFKQGQVDDAIEHFNRVKSLSEEVPAKVYENLGYLYLEKGDPEQAIFYYELAHNMDGENFNLTYGLVNAYISAGNHEKAADYLEPLVQQYPNNPDLRNVYGTQLYEITTTIMQDLRKAYQSSDTALVEQIRFEAEGMGEQAEQELTAAFKRDTTKTEFLESLAVFYNNLAAQYFEVANVAFESDKTVLTKKAVSLVDFAIRYYSDLKEMHPQNEEYKTRLQSLNTIKENRSTPE